MLTDKYTLVKPSRQAIGPKYGMSRMLQIPTTSPGFLMATERKT